MPAQAIVPQKGAPDWSASAAISFIAVSTDCSSVTSHFRYETEALLAVAILLSCAHSAGDGSSRISRQATLPPASTTAMASVIPRPRAPPVIATVLFSREKSLNVDTFEAGVSL